MPGYGGGIEQPSGQSILINGGASICYSRSVTLTLFCMGAKEMQIANGDDPTTGDWEDYATSKAWTLEDTVGSQNVSVRYRFDDPLFTDTATATIYYQSGPGANLRERMIEDVSQLFSNTEEFGETITCSGRTFTTLWDAGSVSNDDGGSSGRMTDTAARTFLPAIQVSSPTVGLEVTKDGETWIISGIEQRDHTGAMVSVHRRIPVERSGQGLRRRV